MVTNNSANIATGATSTVLQGAGVGTAPTFTATPSVTSITFGGTALSVYAEGTWTPTLIGGTSAGTSTYTAQNGYYTKIGNVVFCYCTVSVSAATGTGNLTVGALPFTVKNQSNYNPAFTARIDGTALPASSVEVVAFPVSNATTMIFTGNTAAGAAAIVQITNAAISVYTSFSYQV